MASCLVPHPSALPHSSKHFGWRQLRALEHVEVKLDFCLSPSSATRKPYGLRQFSLWQASTGRGILASDLQGSSEEKMNGTYITSPLLVYIVSLCFSSCSSAVKRHHDGVKFYKQKHLIEGLAYRFRGLIHGHHCG